MEEAALIETAPAYGVSIFDWSVIVFSTSSWYKFIISASVFFVLSKSGVRSSFSMNSYLTC